MSLIQPPSIPVNPDYNWDADPAEQAGYFNPVTLNNKVVQFANLILSTTQVLIQTNRELGESRLAESRIQDDLKDIEDAAIVGKDPTSKDTSNLKTYKSFVLRCVSESGYEDAYNEKLAQLRKLQEDLTKQEIRKENAQTALKGLTLVSENLQTALSFHKAEMKTVYR